MSEPAKVRVVRCPNCESLLPELNDFSVYQCGGCDAFLRAENAVVDPVSEKYDEERIQVFPERLYEKSENLKVSEMSRMNIGHVAEDDTKSNGSSSSNGAERRRLLHYTTNKWAVDGGMETNDNMNGTNHTKINRSFEETKSRIGNENGLQISGEQWHRRLGGIIEIDSFPRNDVVGTSYSTAKYLEKGHLNYQPQGSYGYGEPLKKRNDLDASDNDGFPGENRAELLRKLDELRDQLSRSCDVVEKPKDNLPLDWRTVPPDPYGYPEELFRDGYSAVNRPPVLYPVPDHHAVRPSYVNHYTETSPFMGRHGFYPPHSSGHIQEFGNPSSSQLLRRGPYQAPGHFQQKPPHTQFSGTYVGRNAVHMNSYESYPHNIIHHHPSCSCFHCYSQYQIQGQVPPSAYGARQFSGVIEDPAFHHHEYQSTVGLRDYREQYNGPTSFKSDDQLSHRRWPSDLKSEASDFVRNCPSRVLVTTGSRQCQPVAGGAPFLACQNCHQLLQLPKKVFLNGNLNKIRCGACSILIELTVDSKRLNISVTSETNRANEKFNISSSGDLSELNSDTPRDPNKATVNFASDDFDSSGYNFKSVDREPGSTSIGLGSSIRSADLRSPHSTFSSSSDKEQSLDNLTAMKNDSNYPELRAKGIGSPPPAGSPLQDHFDYSTKYNAAESFADGNRSVGSELDKMIPAKTTLRQNSTHDTSATEIEISSNEYCNTGTSLDSGEASREGDHLRANKPAESIFAGIVKKSFSDSNRSTDNADQGKANVTVNGYLVSDQLIKKAEKLAGRIQPGHYWYDFRAGFWGVIGGPCLGIIPPFIEAFNYPMPENCAGGSTGVFVNGRELHPKDLKLLGSRGLPTEGNRSFILEISGRILDADTGEELPSLGKLAPTIEKLKRGFGMKQPKAVG